ncbi:HAD family hydrolase, partial [Streptomyces sp. SID4985]|nr:HAD family hydrolase [Streptomyces sp. SID4985]
LLAADRAWRPGHGELAEAGWTAPTVDALPDRGVLAGERILREFLGAVGAGVGAAVPGPASAPGAASASAAPASAEVRP